MRLARNRYFQYGRVFGQIILRRTLHLTCWRRDIPFLLNHLGLFLAMTTATLGNADMQRLKMMTVKGEPEWCALTSQQQIIEMPIAIELKEFIMETYDDGKSKRFASDIQILTKTGKTIQTTIEVNKPVEVDGWKIYQYGYDTQMGAMSQYSILELVSDPWLPLVYTGIYMMLAGAVCFMLLSIPWTKGCRQAKKHPKSALLIATLIVAAITWFAYLVYIHYRQIPTHKPKLALWVLLISFVLLQMCWWGINYLPSAQGSSVHVYNMP